MAGKITTLAVQKKNKERVNVFINGQFAFGLTLNVALGLKKGQYLGNEEIAELKLSDEINKAYQKALNFLAYRARSKQEIRKYLEQKDYSEDVIEIAIERLTGHKYVDDADFGRAWVENRIRLNPKGKRALQYELRQKGLNEDDVAQATKDLDEEVLARRAVAKKLKLWRALDEQTLKKKLTGYLARRGFTYETINLIFEQVWHDRE